ncbi:hypothetical protein QP150_14950 [Sphingomonas sp. 22L2VL55-3]
MSIDTIALRKALHLFFLKDSIRSTKLKREAKDELARRSGQKSLARHFHYPFWADAKVMRQERAISPSRPTGKSSEIGIGKTCTLNCVTDFYTGGTKHGAGSMRILRSPRIRSAGRAVLQTSKE